MTRRVLQLLGPSTGGIRRHVAVLAEALPAQGWDVMVAGPAGVMDGLVTGATTVEVGLGVGALWRGRRALRNLARNVDAVHAHGLTAGWLAVVSGLRPPLVATVHNVVLDEVAGRRAWLLRPLERRLGAHVARLIAVSRPIADQVGIRAHRPVSVIVPASPAPRPTRSRDEIRAVLALDPAVDLVVVVARLHPQKGLADLLAAVAACPDRSGWRVALVGEGPQRQELVALAENLRVADTVSFVGAQLDGASWIAAADLVVVPSIWEGSPIVVAEALLLGRPVIATDVGDVADVVSDRVSGRLVPPGHPAELAAVIVDLLGDPDRRASLAAEGRRRAVERYDQTQLVRAVAHVYEEAMAEKSR